MDITSTEQQRIELKTKEIKAVLQAEIAKRELEHFDLKQENEYLRNEVARHQERLLKCQL
jgi:FtsZ-binding cell division protein ZapB